MPRGALTKAKNAPSFAKKNFFYHDCELLRAIFITTNIRYSIENVRASLSNNFSLPWCLHHLQFPTGVIPSLVTFSGIDALDTGQALPQAHQRFA